MPYDDCKNINGKLILCETRFSASVGVILNFLFQIHNLHLLYFVKKNLSLSLFSFPPSVMVNIFYQKKNSC